mmetsp:Transcript_22070/g.52367  ORF Transcript_22070/g.52367 Transcript_22070/m.52367 type:complete len:338 (+) Transcript_22070:661-1674(+)
MHRHLPGDASRADLQVVAAGHVVAPEDHHVAEVVAGEEVHPDPLLPHRHRCPGSAHGIVHSSCCKVADELGRSEHGLALGHRTRAGCHGAGAATAGFKHLELPHADTGGVQGLEDQAHKLGLAAQGGGHHLVRPTLIHGHGRPLLPGGAGLHRVLRGAVAEVDRHLRDGKHAQQVHPNPGRGFSHGGGPLTALGAIHQLGHVLLGRPLGRRKHGMRQGEIHPTGNRGLAGGCWDCGRSGRGGAWRTSMDAQLSNAAARAAKHSHPLGLDRGLELGCHQARLPGSCGCIRPNDAIRRRLDHQLRILRAPGDDHAMHLMQTQQINPEPLVAPSRCPLSA